MRSSKLKTWSDENGTYITVNGITRQLANFRAKVVQEVTEFGLDGETRRYFTLRVQMQDQRFEFEISHLQFEEMAWIRQYLGLDAWIDSERSTKATLLTAIVKASKKRQRISKVKRLGYQKHGDDLYFVFHNGAISAKGHVNTSLIADVDGALKNCYFPPLNDNDDLPELVNKILNIAKIMPRNHFVGTILLAAVFRAILNKFRIAEVTIYILGESGCGKTTVSLVAQSSFGPGFKKPPASWKSTPKSVELSALAASCISLLIDDFTKVQDDKSAIPVIENIIGAVGDGAPRGFALSSIQNSDGAAIEALPIMTGEHIPDVMIDSRKARTCFCLIPTKDDFDKSVVGGYQKDAAAGVYAKVIGAYIQYILQNYQRIESEIEAIFDRYRSDAMSIVDEGLHSRAPSNYADLMLGFHYFLKFCVNSNCLTKQQATEIRKYHSDNLLQLINMQPIIHNTQNINHLVLVEMSKYIRSGQFFLADITPNKKKLPAEKYPNTFIGWVNHDNDTLYIKTDCAHKLIADLPENIRKVMSTGKNAFWKDAYRFGLLAEIDQKSRKNFVRKRINGHEERVYSMMYSLMYTHHDNSLKPKSKKLI